MPTAEELKKAYIKLLKRLFGETIYISIEDLKLHIFTDGFGSIEENLFTNVYFSRREIGGRR